MSALIWFIIAIALFALEATTYVLVSIWFAVGAVITMISVLLGVESIIWQLVVFIVSSSVLLLCTRNFVSKLSKNKEKTNAESLIGKTAIVTGDINNLKEEGEVKLNGLVWAARTADGEAIAAGSRVKIVKISGVKLIVEPMFDMAENK